MAEIKSRKETAWEFMLLDRISDDIIFSKFNETLLIEA